MFHVKHRKENKMKIQLYRNMSDTRKLDKNLAKLAEVTCHLKDNTSVFEPTFIISEKYIDKYFSSFNYVKATDFGRYYYVKDIVAVTGHEVEIHCHSDVLSSFKNYIRNSKAIINRQEYKNTPYIPDEKLPVLLQRTLSTYNFSTPDFGLSQMSGASIALTCTGGE